MQQTTSLLAAIVRVSLGHNTCEILSARCKTYRSIDLIQRNFESPFSKFNAPAPSSHLTDRPRCLFAGIPGQAVQYAFEGLSSSCARLFAQMVSQCNQSV